MSLLEQQDLRAFKLFLFQNHFPKALRLGLRVYFQHQRLVVFVRVRSRARVSNSLVVVLLVVLFASFVNGRLVLWLRQSIRVYLVAIVTLFLVFFFLGLLVVLFLLVTIVLVFGTFFVVVIWINGIVRFIFIFGQLLELAAVEVMLDEEETAILDFFRPFDSW